MARPLSAEPDVVTVQPEKFALDDGTTATTNMQVLKAALVELFRLWPTAVPFAELYEAVLAKLNTPEQQRADVRPLLAALLVRGYVSNLVAVHCEPFRFMQEMSDRPRASALARLIAVEKASVPCLRHRLVGLSPLERAILVLADGTRTVDQIALEAEQKGRAANVSGIRRQPLRDARRYGPQPGKIRARSLLEA